MAAALSVALGLRLAIALESTELFRYVRQAYHHLHEDRRSSSSCHLLSPPNHTGLHEALGHRS